MSNTNVDHIQVPVSVKTITNWYDSTNFILALNAELGNIAGSLRSSIKVIEKLQQQVRNKCDEDYAAFHRAVN